MGRNRAMPDRPAEQPEAGEKGADLPEHLFDHAPLPMLVVARDTRVILAANRAAAALYGYTSQEMEGLGLSTLLPDSTGSADLSFPAPGSAQSQEHSTREGAPLLVDIDCQAMVYAGQNAFFLSIRRVEPSTRSLISEKTAILLDQILGTLNCRLLLSELDTCKVLYSSSGSGENVQGKTRKPGVGSGQQNQFCCFDNQRERLIGADGQPLPPLVSEEFEAETGKWYETVRRAIRLGNGGFACLQTRTDMTRRKQVGASLARRDAILHSMGLAARLFTSRDEFMATMRQILAELGQATQASRVFLFTARRSAEDSTLRISHTCEWTAPGIHSSADSLRDLPLDRLGLASLEQSIAAGQVFQESVSSCSITGSGKGEEAPPQPVIVIPVMVENTLWGGLVFNDCGEKRGWSSVEVDALGTAANILGAVLQRRQMEEELRASRARYRAVVDDQTELICRRQADGVLTFANDAYCKFFKRDRKELLGSNFVMNVPAEDLGLLTAALASLSPDTPVATVDHRVVAGDGSCRWLRWSERAIYGKDGGLSEYQSVGRDITERKHTSLLLQQQKELVDRIIQTANALVVTLDPQGRIGRFNDFAQKLTGYSLQEVEGRSWFELFIEPAEWPDMQAVFQGVASGDERFRTWENAIRCRDGSRREISWRNSLLSDEHGDKMAILAIGMDVTEAKMLAQRLQQSEKMASLGLLISGITHEINNPNNFITFNLPILRDYLNELLQLLEDLQPDTGLPSLLGMEFAAFREDLFKILDNMEHGTNRITSTVSRLREFTRPRRGERLEWTSLNEVVDRAIELCRPQIMKTIRNFDLRLPKKNQRVYSDPQALEQILINLLVNASQAVDKKDSFLKVSGHYRKSDQQHVVIEIADNGCGMDDAIRDRIFEPYFTTKHVDTGTGLGLFISQNLALGLGGHLEVESSKGQGSTFRIVLPRLTPGKARHRRKDPHA